MSTSLEGYRILVVEDEPQFRAVLRAMLERTGYAVAVADRVESAVPMLDDFGPHAVIVDGSLPGASGLTFAAHIRKSDKHRTTKIIHMSGDPEMKELAEILKSQYDVFLQKPFPLRALLEALDRLLPRRAAAGL